MSRFNFADSEGHEAWLNSHTEPVLQPTLPIIDAHHHLWMREGAPYLLRAFVADLATGHNIVASVFAECHSMYRKHGAQSLRPVGESEFVAGIAAMSDSGTFGDAQICKAMFGGVDFELGASIEPVLEAHHVASGGRFRGVRISCGWDESDKIHNVVPQANLLSAPSVREAFAVIQRQGVSLDCWVYHTQLGEVAEVADAFPDLQIILNHLGSPILGGPYRDHRDTVFSQWRESIAELAQRGNVVMKLGALPIRLGPKSGYPDTPPTSAEIDQEWRPWVESAIEVFGAKRCMFESNFPVHKNWCSYPVLWNAFKKMSDGASSAERLELFFGCANQTYKMGLPSPE